MWEAGYARGGIIETVDLIEPRCRLASKPDRLTVHESYRLLDVLCTELLVLREDLLASGARGLLFSMPSQTGRMGLTLGFSRNYRGLTLLSLGMEPPHAHCCRPTLARNEYV